MRREVARAPHAPPDRVLHVELIERERPVVTPAPLLPLPSPIEHRPRGRIAPHAPPREARPEPVPSERPRLFGLDGRILLPDAQKEEKANALAPSIPHGDPFARANPLPYEPTRFDKYFPDVRESLGGEIMRHTTLTYAWRTPWGTVWECKTNLILLGIGGCTWGPAPTLTIEELKALRADPPPSPPWADPVPAPATSDPPQPVQP